MKKCYSLFVIILMLPIVLCSCFDTQIYAINLNEANLSLNVGETRTLTATIAPDNATNKSLSWSSSNKDIASVSSDGTIKAISDGETVISATTKNGLSASCNITVKKLEVTAITLSDQTTSVNEGENIQITAKLQPSGVSDDNLVWSSSNEDIALVNSSGYVTGIKAGISNIVCTSSNGKNASCTVTVKPKNNSKSTSSKSTSSKSTSASNKYETPEYIGNNYKNSFIFYDSSYRKLRDAEVVILDSDSIQYAINEIYARNGYVFKTKEIQEYYESQSWYYPNTDFSISDLNTIESYNVSLLSKYR